jgi:hypothetical protein
MGNPLRFTDPTGKCFWDLCAAEGAATATVIVMAAAATKAYLDSPSQSLPGFTNGQAITSRFSGLLASASESIRDAASSLDKSWFPGRTLPRSPDGVAEGDVEYPHTQLGKRKGSRGDYPVSREFDENGEVVRDIDWTDHGRADHADPHQHKYGKNSTGGTKKRGQHEPLEPEDAPQND